MSQQIVILAAGKGTRMAGVAVGNTAEPIPKVLIPLNGKPVIERLLDEVKKLEQDTSPIIVVGYMKELVEQTLGKEYIYVTQFDQKGTAHAVLSAKDSVTADNIIVLNGDMPFISKESLSKLVELHTSTNSVVTMFPCTLPNFENENHHFLGYGRVIRDAQGDIIKIQEYKDCSEEQKQITEVNTGEYMFNSAWLWNKLTEIGSTNAQGEFYLTDIVELAIKDGHKIQSIQIAPEEVYGINTPEHLEYARKLVSGE